MERKNFLSALLLSAFGMPALKAESFLSDADKEIMAIVPAYLKKGDTIGITCPAGYISHEEIEPAILLMESWGFKIKKGNTIGLREYGFGGSDEQRAADLQAMLDDVSVKAIMCARGGYGAVRMVDKLRFNRFMESPKWVIGFSDITVLHAHINRNYGVASIHSKMCNSFPEDWQRAEPVIVDCILSIRRALTGEKMMYEVPASALNRKGRARGALVGGNLKTIESLAGSPSDLKTVNKILFVEDTGEYLYSIDRMFWNLKRTGKLSHLKGLIIGGFKLKPDDQGEEFGRSLYDIVLEKVKEYDYPVCFDFPVGHQKNNVALKCGVEHVLEVSDTGAVLKEYN